MEKRYDRIEEFGLEIEKSADYIDNIEEVQKFNPYHGKDGRFTSASGGGMAGAKLGDTVDWKGKPHVIVGDSGGEDGQLKLRPASRFGGDDDFKGGGDSFDDVHIDRYQLRNAGGTSSGGFLAGKKVYAKDEDGVLKPVNSDYVKQVESKIQHHKEKLERLMDKHGPGGNSDRRTDIERTKKKLKEYEAEYNSFVAKD